MNMLRNGHNRLLSSLLVWLACVSTCAGAQSLHRQRTPVMRSKPPTQWGPVERGVFSNDAFSLLHGDEPPIEPPPPPPPPPREFDRNHIMQQLEKARAAVDDLLVSKQVFARQVPQAALEVDEVITLGQRLAQDDPDYSADGYYVRHANEMAKAARWLKELLGTARHEEALDAGRAMNAACVACHTKFKQ